MLSAASICLPSDVAESRRDIERYLPEKSYKEMGGVTGALVQHAEGVLAGLTTQEVTLAKKMLLRLVTEDKTRRIMSQKDLLLGLQERGPGSAGKTSGIAIGDHQSQRTDKEEGECELVHEALVSNWKRLNNWIDESREELGLLRQLEQAARLWEKRGRRVDDLWNKQALKESAIVLEASDFPRTSKRGLYCH